MASRNDITGDLMKSKPTNQEYRNNFDNIKWGVLDEEKVTEKQEEDKPNEEA